MIRELGPPGKHRLCVWGGQLGVHALHAVAGCSSNSKAKRSSLCSCMLFTLGTSRGEACRCGPTPDKCEACYPFWPLLDPVDNTVYPVYMSSNKRCHKVGCQLRRPQKVAKLRHSKLASLQALRRDHAKWQQRMPADASFCR